MLWPTYWQDVLGVGMLYSGAREICDFLADGIYANHWREQDRVEIEAGHGGRTAGF